MTNIPVPPTEPDPVKDDSWKPEKPGDSIAGVVIKRETVHSEKYKRDFDVLTVKNGSDEETRVPCARSHLAQLLEEHDPQPGDGIAISFFGEKPDGWGYQYAMRVSKGGDDDEPDF
jgi:hypothetical protein